MALKIAMFSDFICPFCYIGFEVISKLKREFEFELDWRSFEIHPEWPTEATPADKVRGLGDAEARKAAWGRITSMAEAEGLAITAPAMLVSSHFALLAAELAKEQGVGMEFCAKVYRGYFVDGADIGDPETLARFGAEAGLARDAVLDALSSQHFEMRLKNTALAAHQRQVSGVPTFFFGEYPLVGAQSSDVMRQIIRRATERLAASA